MELFIADYALHAMQSALAQGLAPSAREQAEYLASRSGSASSALNLAGDVARIRVDGVLTKRPSLLSLTFGGGNTTYSELLDAIATAKRERHVRSVLLEVDSPGGEADGLFEVLAALEDLRGTKPITVRAANAYSAAYGIAAASGGSIEATNPGAGFGSVGAAISFWVSDRVVEITNTDSPDKRPDVTTPQGKAIVRRHLDAVHGLLVDAIASGRKTSPKTVSEEYGRGASFVAGEALQRGMIDRILGPHDTAEGGSQLAMAKLLVQQVGRARKLSAEHPELSLPELALAAGCDRGVVAAIERKTGEKVRRSMTPAAAPSDREETLHAALDILDERRGKRRTPDGGPPPARAQAIHNETLHAALDILDEQRGKRRNEVTASQPTADLGDQVWAIIEEQGGL